MSWWIMIICSRDYYNLYHSTVVIHAESAHSAVARALPDSKGHLWVELVFGPFDKEPVPVSLVADGSEIDPECKVYSHG